MSTTIFNGTATTTTTYGGSNNYIISDLGHITVHNGDALVVTDYATVFVNGGIYSSNIGITVTGAANGFGNRLEIGEHASVVASSGAAPPSGWGVYINGKVQEFINHGYIEGDDVGVVLWFSPSAIQFDNYGYVSGSAAVRGQTSQAVTINNHLGGVLQGDTDGIYQGTEQGGPVTVVNDGAIIGTSYAILTFAQLTLTNNNIIIGKVGSVTGVTGKGTGNATKIVNRGEMRGDEDGVAIALGDTADVVKNKGVIDGAVWLGAGNDIYKGGSDHETVYGGRGKDTIETKGGADVVSGGRGKDKIKPGAGKDVIMHAVGDGRDKVFKFKPGRDVIDLSDHDFSGFAHLKSAITKKKGHLHFDLTGSDKLVLKDVDLADLSADDFVL